MRTYVFMGCVVVLCAVVVGCGFIAPMTRYDPPRSHASHAGLVFKATGPTTVTSDESGRPIVQAAGGGTLEQTDSTSTNQGLGLVTNQTPPDNFNPGKVAGTSAGKEQAKGGGASGAASAGDSGGGLSRLFALGAGLALVAATVLVFTGHPKLATLAVAAAVGCLIASVVMKAIDLISGGLILAVGLLVVAGALVWRYRDWLKTALSNIHDAGAAEVAAGVSTEIKAPGWFDAFLMKIGAMIPKAKDNADADKADAAPPNGSP